MLPDYARGVNFDHIGPHVASGRVEASPFSFDPTPSQYSRHPMDFDLDACHRAYDLTCTLIEQPIVYPVDHEIAGVPIAGLYPSYEYAGRLDEHMRYIAAIQHMTLVHTQALSFQAQQT